MYVFFYGSDRSKVRDSATLYIDKNLPTETTISTIEANDYQSGWLMDMLGANSLFGGQEWFMLDTPSDNCDFSADVNKSLAELANSNNVFVILESSLLAPEKKKYTKYATEITEFNLDKGKVFNVFSLAEALTEKDKRRLWVLLQEAKLEGLRAEEMVGILWWQLKVLRLAKFTNSAAEAGMKDYPYNNAKRALTKFSEGEVKQLAQSLLELYHDGHAGLRDTDVALEEWVLSV